MTKAVMRSLVNRKRSLSVAVVLATAGSTSALAFQIPMDNPEASLTWDTTLRYNTGWRLEDVNPHFANAFLTDESETMFKKHDRVLSRVDLFTEVDYSVRTQGFSYGARVSASAWSEHAYPGQTRTGETINSTLGAGAPPSNYGAGGNWSLAAKRFTIGSSGEINDAFVSAGVKLGSTALDVKVGQHNVFWGESFLLAQNSVAHQQGPTDSAKGLMSPGLDAKESFMPLNRISAIWNLSPAFAMLGEYTLDWKPGRSPAGGTYFSSTDASDAVYSSVGSNARGLSLRRWLDPITPGRDGGDYGIGLRWNPSFDTQGGSMGFYYRKYAEKNPWSATQVDALGNSGTRLVYPRDTELLGVSYSTRLLGISTGMEFSYRRNAALSSRGMLARPLALTQTPSYEQVEGARGNTYHFVLNGTIVLPASSFWETGNFLAELGYARLDKVTKNPNLFLAEGYAACSAGMTKRDGCSTKDNLTAAMRFSPQWFGVLPSWDLTIPISVTYSLHGNNPTNATADYQGLYSWSIGATMLYKTTYEFGLTINDRYMRYATKPSTIADGVGGTIYDAAKTVSIAQQNNHRWLNFRFKTTF